MSTTANGRIGAKFWVPILVMSLLSVGMGGWAVFEKVANSRVIDKVNETTVDVRIARERNIVQDQQLLLMAKDIGIIQEQNKEMLNLIKRHMGIPTQ
jgi:hypothetical protein